MQASALALGTLVAVAVGTLVIGAHVASRFIRSTLEEYRTASQMVDSEKERSRREREIRDINSEIGEYEDKRLKDGRLGQYESHELDELYRRRQRESALLADANGLVIANRIVDGEGTYDKLRVSDVNTHVLQFHVGQTVFGKACGRCGMPMVLQWKQRLETLHMADFFWGCTGFFDRRCHNVEQFKQSDMDLFTRTDREEFTIGAAQLTSIARLPQSVRVTKRRMDEIVNLPNNTYYCPVHHEPMVLRRKNRPESLRDMYFYGCPRWRPEGPSCQQVVKLKSAAQLSAALETKTGKGML